MGGQKRNQNDSDNNAARIVLKNLQLGNAKNVLKVDISRTNATKSPTKIAVSYSTDGTNYTELGEISLLTDKTDWKNYEVNLDAAKNQNITLRMTPYHYEGNSSALKFDNIVITKNNP